jgi:hypothetical protein
MVFLALLCFGLAWLLAGIVEGSQPSYVKCFVPTFRVVGGVAALSAILMAVQLALKRKRRR